MRDKIIQCTIVNGTKNNDINGKNSDLIQSFLLFINIGDWKPIVTESIPSLIEVDYRCFSVYQNNKTNKNIFCQGDKEENSQIFLCFSPSVSILELIVKLYISIVLFSWKLKIPVFLLLVSKT